MEFEDKVTIYTPEGVDLHLTLAGLGTRMSAALLDFLIKLVFFLALGFALVRSGVAIALFVSGALLVELGYGAILETINSGRTPGKSVAGIRVLKSSGAPIGFREAAIRSLLAVVDGPGSGYVLGVVSILLAPRNQRLGDLAAGTIVVRDRQPVSGPALTHEESRNWDITAITDEDLSVVRRFLSRRETLTDEARSRLAAKLTSRYRELVVGDDLELSNESFLEVLAATKSARA